ncbi:hypothetical protein [Streptomyces althioticus]|uniref:hypothetical protein n=1 Tax=Streptomyces althioticus TaxID=83380 RepID=UPI0037F8D9BD
MSAEQLPVAEPADVPRAAGERVPAGRRRPLTAAKASASGAHHRLPEEPEHGHRTARGAGPDTHQEVPR